MLRSWTLLAALSALIAGCTTASIHLRDGKVVEGWIQGGDENSIQVIPADSSEAILILREDIDDIDHPGNVLATVFTPLSVMGGLMFIGGIAQMGYLIFMVSLPGAALAMVTTPPAVAGWTLWRDSKKAARRPFQASARPLAFSDGEQTYYGMGLEWRW